MNPKKFPPSKLPQPITEAQFLQKSGQSIGKPLNYAPWYREIAERLPDGAVVVEVGVYKGRSADYLVDRMREAKKTFAIHLVDVMTLPFVMKHVTKLRKTCAFHPCESVKAAARFANHSVDFVWIDADHSYDGVCADIAAWLPKVKPGGVIAGHDYYDDPAKNNFVQSAIDELFPDARTEHKSWWVEVDENTATTTLQKMAAS